MNFANCVGFQMRWNLREKTALGLAIFPFFIKFSNKRKRLVCDCYFTNYLMQCSHFAGQLTCNVSLAIVTILIIGSAEALPILCVRYFRWEREIQTDREMERDGSDVTIVALKLAMNLHFPLPKIRTIGDELTLSLAKNSHFSFLPSHFPSLPSPRGHHCTCGAEIRNEFTLSIAKNVFALFVPPLSNGTSRDEWLNTQDKWSNPAQSYFVLAIEKMNQINTKNYWK